jgi:hypothetical protein
LQSPGVAVEAVSQRGCVHQERGGCGVALLSNDIDLPDSGLGLRLLSSQTIQNRPEAVLWSEVFGYNPDDN